MSDKFYHLINGERLGGDEWDEIRNPANINQVVARFPHGTAATAQRAIEAARSALPAWADMPPPARGAILERASGIIEERLEDMAATLTREEGKTIKEARGEVGRARDIFRYYGGEGWRSHDHVIPSNSGGELLYTRREPLGVVGVITPWNFPVAIPAWKMAPALAYGNTVVFKPAGLAPGIGLMLVEALVEAGLPPGVVNFVHGSGREVGEVIVSSPEVNGISFTGSHQVGTQIYAKAIQNLTRVQLEMGGKNPLIVLNDADLDLAVRLAALSGFGVTGQACTAASRLIVENGIADRFVERLVDASRSLVVGDGLDEATQMGPAVSQDQLETDLTYVQVGRKEGARLRAGGDRAGDNGYFIQPTVFDNVTADMRIAQEEIFGPVVSVTRVNDLQSAIVEANNVRYGLSAGIVTNDLQKAFTFANQIEAGVVKVNEPTTGLALQAPFGGFKHSSSNTFKEQGAAAIEFYTRTKTIYMGHG